MSTTNPTAENRTACIARHGYLGRDTEGYHHHVDRVRDVVYRFDDAGEMERVVDLEGRNVNQFKRFVEQQIGWATRETLLTVSFEGAMGGRR